MSIKDPINPNRTGGFPTRMLIPATNFLAAFTEMDYIGLKEIIGNYLVINTKDTIIKASQVNQYW